MGKSSNIKEGGGISSGFASKKSNILSKFGNLFGYNNHPNQSNHDNLSQMDL